MSDSGLPVLNQNTYVKESALALWENLPKVLLYGSLFSLFSLPAVTISLVFNRLIFGLILAVFTVGPAWTVLNEALSRTILREPYSFLSFLKGFGHYYQRSLVLATFLAIPAVSLARDLPLLVETPVAALTWVRLGTAVAGSAFLMALSVYAYPIMVLYDVNVRLALKNSLVLAIKYFGNTSGLLAMAGLLAWSVFRVSAFLWIIVPACWLVFVINNCRMVVSFELEDTQKDSDLKRSV